jgi:hypothetical protein
MGSRKGGRGVQTPASFAPLRWLCRRPLSLALSLFLSSMLFGESMKALPLRIWAVHPLDGQIFSDRVSSQSFVPPGLRFHLLWITSPRGSKTVTVSKIQQYLEGFIDFFIDF